jgi:hypothetical protein
MAAAVVLASSACSYVVEPERLTEGCAEDEKLCADGCQSKDRTKYGCGSEDCKPCNFDHATAECRDGKCSFVGCESGWGDCNKDVSDGCETDIHHNVDHCGSCDNVCPARENASPGCRGGDCAISMCDPGWGDCNDDFEDGCEERVNTIAHCGGCDEDCDAETEVCNALMVCEPVSN